MVFMKGWVQAFELFPHTIYLTLAGSHAYGLDTPESDIDLRGIAIPPKEYALGFAKQFKQCERRGEDDVVIFNIVKFFELAADANPSIFELLWTDPKFHVLSTKYFEMMVEAREMFLSRRIEKTFTGYAYGQLKRINTHRGWLLNPPKEKPKREDYGLSNTRIVSRDQEGALKVLLGKGTLKESDIPTSFLEVLIAEYKYDAALRNWKSYEDWKTNRNPARAILEERYGFDVKHASHLARLMLMGQEVQTTGKVKVLRDDAEIFRGIRRGEWSYEQLIEWMETKDREIRDFAAKGPHVLPEEPNLDKLNQLCMKIQETFFKDNP